MDTLSSVYERIKRHTTPSTDLTIYDGRAIEKGLNDEFYNPLYVKVAKKALEIILYNSLPFDVNNKKGEKIRYWFDGQESKIIGEGKSGIVFSSNDNVTYGALDSFYLIKTNKKRSENLIYEYVIGSILNSLRDEKGIFNFMYMYADFTCGPPLQKNNTIISWCHGDPKTYYLIVENVPGITLDQFIKEEEFIPIKCLSIILQLHFALKIACEQFTFHHRDLHAANVIIRTLLNEVLLPYEEWYVKTQYIAVIIDYGMAILQVDEGKIAVNKTSNTTRSSISGDLYRVVSNMYIILLNKNKKTENEFVTLKILYGIMRQFLTKEDQIRLSRLPELRKRISKKIENDNQRETMHYKREIKYFGLKILEKELCHHSFLHLIQESSKIAKEGNTFSNMLFSEIPKYSNIPIAKCGPSYCETEPPLLIVEDNPEALTYPFLAYGIRVRSMLSHEEIELLYENTNKELSDIIEKINILFEEIDKYKNYLLSNTKDIDKDKEDGINYIVKLLDLITYSDRLVYLRNTISYVGITREEERMVLDIDNIIKSSIILTNDDVNILKKLREKLKPLLITREEAGVLESFTSVSFNIAMDILLSYYNISI